MSRKSFVVWRWAEPSKKFKPTKNRSWGDMNLKSYNFVVFAGLKPTDWAWLFNGSYLQSRGLVLHKIMLTEQKASLCVVAEQKFRPTEEEINRYLERTGRNLVGSLVGYSMEQYEKSFIPLCEYKGGYNLPEVLIPFEVEAKVDGIRTLWLKLKARMRAFLRRVRPL